MKPVNKLMITTKTTEPAPSPRPFANLQENKIHISGMDTTQRKFTITLKEKFLYQ